MAHPSPVLVLDVTAVNFRTEVLERSQAQPVVLDFWAPWCGPCQVLGPLLERLATEARGAFLLGKVNVDSEPELAAAFQVQSIPFVVGLKDGRPVDAFVGSLPEKEVRAFLQRLGVEPSQAAPPPPATPSSPEEQAFTEATVALRQGRLEGLEEILDRIPEEHERHGAAQRLREGLEWFRLADGPPPPGEGPMVPLLRGARAFREGRLQEALEECLASVRMDRSFREGLARRAMVALFTLLGEEDPLTEEHRRLLAQALY